MAATGYSIPAGEPVTIQAGKLSVPDPTRHTTTAQFFWNLSKFKGDKWLDYVKALAKQIVGKRTAQWLRDYYVQDNLKLAKSHGLPLADFGYPMEAAGMPDRDRPGRWRSILRF